MWYNVFTICGACIMKNVTCFMCGNKIEHDRSIYLENLSTLSGTGAYVYICYDCFMVNAPETLVVQLNIANIPHKNIKDAIQEITDTDLEKIQQLLDFC